MVGGGISHGENGRLSSLGIDGSYGESKQAKIASGSFVLVMTFWPTKVPVCCMLREGGRHGRNQACLMLGNRITHMGDISQSAY